MRGALVFAAACVVAGAVPLAHTDDGPHARFLGTLVPPGAAALPLQPGEADFPGDVARYRDGDDVVLVRRVNGATRGLHPSTECLRATGWDVRAGGMAVDDGSRAWATGTATRGTERLSFRERVTCDDGTAFPDVSAAFWHALGAPTLTSCTAVTRSARVAASVDGP